MDRLAELMSPKLSELPSGREIAKPGNDLATGGKTRTARRMNEKEPDAIAARENAANIGHDDLLAKTCKKW